MEIDDFPSHLIEEIKNTWESEVWKQQESEVWKQPYLCPNKNRPNKNRSNNAEIKEKQ